MSTTLEFIVVFWGKKYRDFFARFCLPSFLAPDNMPVFSGPASHGFRGRLIIASTREDYAETEKEPLFQRLLEHVEVEFIDVGLPNGVHPQIHMSQGHKLGLQRIIDRKSFGTILAPDIVLSNGAISTLIRYLSSGACHILIPALRFDLDKCVEGLTRIGALRPGEPLAVAPRDLAKIGTASLHSEKRVLSLGVRPAPLTPLLASMMMSVGSIQPSLMNGASPRIAVLV